MNIGRYSRRMVAGGVGPLSSLPVLVFLPIAGAFMLPVSEFAVWTILNSVATVALATDFGGVAYVAANASRVQRPWSLVAKGTGISAIGTTIVCAFSMIVWIPYSTTAAAGGWSAEAGVAAIFVVLVASVFRGGTSVVAAAALARFDYHTRNVLLLGQAILVVLCTVLLILVSSSAWSLPLGWLIGSALSMLLVVSRVRRDYRRNMGALDTGALPQLIGSAREFTVKRTAASLLSNVLSQGDRWIVGVAAGPEFLAAYELVWRFASAPRVVAMSLTASLIPDAKLAATTYRLDQLLRESTRTIWKVSAAAAVVSAGLIGVLGIIGKVDTTAMILGVVLLLSLTVNGRTAVTSMTGIGIGRVGIDIPYLSLMVLLTAGVWIVGIFASSGIITVVGGAIILLGVSILFTVRAERSMVRSSVRPTDVHIEGSPVT